MLDAVGDIQIIVHLAQIGDEQLDLLVIIGAAQSHVVGNVAVTLLGGGILGVEGDDLGQIHGIGCSRE